MKTPLLLLCVAVISGLFSACSTTGGHGAAPAGLAARAAITATRSSVQSVRDATNVVKTSTASAGRKIDEAQKKADEVAQSFLELDAAIGALEKSEPMHGNMDVARARLAERQAQQEVEALRESLASAQEATKLANGQAEIADEKAAEADKHAQEADASAEALIASEAAKARALEISEAKREAVTAKYHKLKFVAASLAAGFLGYLAYGLLSVMVVVPLPYRWAIAAGAGAAGFAAVWIYF